MFKLYFKEQNLSIARSFLRFRLNCRKKQIQIA